MKIAICAVSLHLLGTACAPASDTTNTEARRIVAARWAEYEEAYEASDVTRLGAFYTDSVWIRGPDPGVQSIRGREAAEEIISEAMASVTVLDIAFVPEDVVPFGRHAFDSGTWSEEFTLPGSADLQRIAGSYTVLWEQEDDGEWRISRLMWNVHTPGEAAAGENE